MPTQQKERVVKETVERLDGVRGIYLTDFSGMTVEKVSLMRKQLREASVHYEVIKNTLLKRALNERGITELDPYLEGPTGVAMSVEDEMGPARILSAFAKEHERPRIKAAVVEGRLFDEAAVKQIAALPSREVLLQQVLGTFIAPMTQFLGAIEATLRLPATMADVLAREREKGAS